MMSSTTAAPRMICASRSCRCPRSESTRALIPTEVAVSGHFVTLHPKRASFVGLPAPVVGILRGYLPLPPLPRGARLVKVDHEDERVTAWFALDDIDQPLTPAIARRLRPRLLPRFRF